MSKTLEDINITKHFEHNIMVMLCYFIRVTKRIGAGVSQLGLLIPNVFSFSHIEHYIDTH